MRKQIEPHSLSSPGEVLSDLLKKKKMSQRDLSDILQRPPKTINEIIKGKKSITPETALQLEQVFELPAEYWLKAEYDYQLYKAKQELNVLKQTSPDIHFRTLMQRVPLREMQKLGWLQLGTSLEENIEKVRKFLNLSKIEDNLVLNASFRKTQTKEPNEDHIYAWLQQVRFLANQRKLGAYNNKAFEAALPGIVNLSVTPEAIRQVPEILKGFGVHFLIVPHLSKTYLDGAALYHGENPVIALTLRYNRLDAFWFNFLHEAGHIIKGHVSPDSQVCLDSFEERTEPWIKGQINKEQEADDFAAKLLFPGRKFDKFVQSHSPHFSEEAIESFASLINRHPAIVVGRLQHEGEIAYSAHRQFLGKAKELFENDAY